MSFIGDLFGGGGSPAVPAPSDDQYMTAIINQVQLAAKQQAEAEAQRRAMEQQAAQQAEQQRQQQEQQKQQQAAQQAEQQAEQQRVAREAELQKQRDAQNLAAEQARVQRLKDLRIAAADSTRSGVNSYFSERGADPTQYSSQIDQLIQSALTSVDPNSETPSSFLNATSLGSGLYGDLESARRNDATNQVKARFGDNYGTTKIGDTADDSILGSIEDTQYGSASAIIDNMLKRGVITPTGATAARTTLDAQRPTVHSNLATVGSGALSIGRGKLDDIVNRAMSGASTLSLGGSFNPDAFTNEADTAYNSFMSSLPDTLKNSAPGNLFNTSNLAATAGRSQGAQNTKFDPDALSGILDTGSPDQEVETGTRRKSKNPNAPYVF